MIYVSLFFCEDMKRFLPLVEVAKIKTEFPQSIMLIFKVSVSVNLRGGLCCQFYRFICFH